MHIERVPNRNSPPAVLLRQSYREGGKVRKRTLANLSKLPDEAVEGLKILLKGGTAIDNLQKAFEIIRSRPHGHVAAVLGMLRKLAEIQSPDYPGERLIACRNPILAAERARKREALLQATEREIDKVVVATNREKRPLKGAANIGLRVGKVLNRFKVAKHFHLEITDNSFHYERHSENIAAEGALDGLYVIRTSVSEQLFDSQETVRAYKSLSTVERAFRSYSVSQIDEVQ